MRKITTILLLSTAAVFLSACSAPNITTDQTTAAHTVAKARTSSAVTSAVDRHMVYLGGKVLADTGRSPFLTTSNADGQIASETADAQSVPNSEAEANFDCIGSSYISLSDGAAAILLNDEYHLFLADDTVEYEGIYKKKKDVSEDTLKWLDFYYGLPEKDRKALSMVPEEFSEAVGNVGIAAISALETTGDAISYIQALTESELAETESLAQTYFTDDVPVFEGVDQIYPVDSDASLYSNSGLEGEYPPGNIIIYKVLTVKDRRDGNPFRFISIARRTKSDSWKIINCGY